MNKSRMILPAVVLLLAATTIVWSQGRAGDRTTFAPTRIVTELSSDQAPGTPAIRSIASAVFNVRADGTVHYKIQTTGLDNVTAINIHQTTGPRQNGPLIASLFVPNQPTGWVSGTIMEGDITQDNLRGPLAGGSVNDLVSQMMNNNVYVNIATTRFPDGAVRGYIPYPYN